MAVCPAGRDCTFEEAPIYGVACRRYNKNCTYANFRRGPRHGFAVSPDNREPITENRFKRSGIDHSDPIAERVGHL